MNLIKKTTDYEGRDICPICQEPFQGRDNLMLIRHLKETGHAEKLKDSRRRKHLFHESCLRMYLETSPIDNIICPFDREKIYCLLKLKYYEIISPNIIEFDSYYNLLDKMEQKDIGSVSIIDHINVNCKDINGKTLIYCACQRGNIRIIHQLIRLGGNPTIPDDNGFTPLMAVVSHNYQKILKYLLTLPIIRTSINQVDNRGKSALEYATEFEHWGCVSDLLSVEGYDHAKLLTLLTYYQHLKRQSPILISIKQQLRHHLKDSTITQTGPQLRLRPISVKVTEKSNFFNLDINKNPDLFNILYEPVNPQGLSLPPDYNDEEIRNISRFNQFDEKLIYGQTQNIIHKNNHIYDDINV